MCELSSSENGLNVAIVTLVGRIAQFVQKMSNERGEREKKVTYALPFWLMWKQSKLTRL